MPRRKYTREFKESAVRLIRQQGYTVAQAARSLGVDAANIRGWLMSGRRRAGHLLAALGTGPGGRRVGVVGHVAHAETAGVDFLPASIHAHAQFIAAISRKLPGWQKQNKARQDQVEV
ncbi:MAG: transposase [Phycisphaeraceae bacterium]|nr:transposase [Phycisphaeraceae bacterium]